MKLHEVIDVSDSTEQLNEITTKQVIAAGSIALAALGINKRMDDKAEFAKQQAEKRAVAAQAATSTTKAQELEHQINALAAKISKRYRSIAGEEAKAIAALAKRYEKPDFPRAQDILAIIGIESAFNPNAQSNLKTDPAVGLMQVRPKIWGINPGMLKTNVEKQVQFGSEILHKYYQKLNNKEEAIQAYNIGMTNFMKGKQQDAAQRYITKYKKELNHFAPEQEI